MSSVLFLSAPLHSGGGLELCELAIAGGLAERGWDVTTVHEGEGDLAPAWRSFGGTIPRHELDAGAPRPDVVYVHAPSLYSEALQLASAWGSATVAHLHLPPEHLRTGWKAAVRGRQRVKEDPSVVSRRTRVDRFLAVSASIARSWTLYGVPAERIHVVHNGTDIERFHPGSPTERAEIRVDLGVPVDAVAVGYVGRLDPLKGIEQLLAAYRSMAQRSSRRLCLVVCGEATAHLGGAQSEYGRQLRAGSPPGVIWLGKRTDVDRVYRALDLVVVPSQWDEPFGLVAIEALASEVPVIATRRGGLAEVFTGSLAGMLVGTSAGQIEAGMRAALSDPVALARLGVEGRRVVAEQFEIGGSVDRVAAHLTAAVQGHLEEGSRC